MSYKPGYVPDILRITTQYKHHQVTAVQEDKKYWQSEDLGIDNIPENRIPAAPKQESAEQHMEAIARLRLLGWSHQAISDALGLAKTQTQYWWGKWKEKEADKLEEG